MSDENLGGMDGIEELAPAPQTERIEQPQPEQSPGRVRDDQGRFSQQRQDDPAPQRGKPDQEAARRREAAERDEWKNKFEEAETRAAALAKRFDDMQKIARGDEGEGKPDPLAELGGKVDTIAKSLEQQQRERQTEAAWTQVRSYADNDEQQFRQTQPDFPEAVQHYIASRLTEMQALGLDQQQAEQALTQEAQDLLMQCAQGNRSPSATIYSMAKARGYSGQQQQMRTVPSARPAGGRSLGTGSGTGAQSVTASQIASMSEEDYNAYRATPEGKRAIQRLMAGAA